MSIKKLPYGISNYERIVEDNMYYVDKTRYIEELENQLVLRYKNKSHNIIDNMKFKKNPIYYNNIYKKEKINNSNNNRSKINSNSKFITKEFKNIKKNKSNISDFNVFDNNNNFEKTNNIINSKNNKNLGETNVNEELTLKNNNIKNIKRNNSSILNNTWINDKNNINKKSRKSENLKNNIKIKNDYFAFNKKNEISDGNVVNKDKIIIRNCNCIIDLNPDNDQNFELFKNTFSNINNRLKKIENLKFKNNQIIEEKKIIQERYLIIDEKQKPIYIKGKQVLGMNLMPLRGENNEIISDNDKNIFLYDLDGGLHNQKDLENIRLDNGRFLVNENNIPILGINNIPIIDQYGDFIFRRSSYEKNNYIIGVYADILRDKEGKPIKLLIEKNISNQNKNIENKTFNNNLNTLNKTINKGENQMKRNNPVVEIELKPYTKIITSKDQNYYYYLKNHQRNKSPFNDKNKFNFEKSLRNYFPKIKMKKNKKK